MAKRKQQNNVSPKSARRIQKHKLSDIRWRTNLAKTFKILDRTIVKCTGVQSTEHRSRISILEESLNCIQTLEAKVQELCAKNASQSGFKCSETLPKCYTLDYFRDSFNILDKSFNSCANISKSDQNCHLSDDQKSDIITELLKLDVRNISKSPKLGLRLSNFTVIDNIAPKSNFTSLTQRSNQTQLSSTEALGNVPFQVYSSASMTESRLPISRCENETCVAFGSSSFNPSASSNLAIHSIPFTPKKGCEMDETKINKYKSKFAPPRLSTKVRRRLDMDKAVINTVQMTNASADEHSNSPVVEVNEVKPNHSMNSNEQGDITKLSDDFQYIELCDLNIPNIELDELLSLDYDVNEDFAEFNGKSLSAEVAENPSSKQSMDISDDLLSQFLSGVERFKASTPTNIVSVINSSELEEQK